MVKIINNEGIEKIIDISNNGANVNQGTVPMLDLAKLRSSSKHYYFNTDSYAIGDTLNRLKYKY